jgi:hypothetical protein
MGTPAGCSAAGNLPDPLVLASGMPNLAALLVAFMRNQYKLPNTINQQTRRNQNTTRVKQWV